MKMNQPKRWSICYRWILCLPGPVGNDGLALVEEGVVHTELVEGALDPVLERLSGDRLNHRRQQREAMRRVVELLACENKTASQPWPTEVPDT